MIDVADIESDDELCGDRHMPVRLRGLVAAAEIAGSAPDGSSSDRNEFGFYSDFSGDTGNLRGIRSCVDGFKVALEPSFR